MHGFHGLLPDIMFSCASLAMFSRSGGGHERGGSPWNPSTRNVPTCLAQLNTYV